MLDVHHVLHILRRQRLKIQLVRDIKVRAHGLRIVVDDDRLIARFGKSPGSVDGAVVEFDSLPDADGAASQHQHLLRADGTVRAQLAASGFLRLVFPAIYGIVIRGACRELGGTGIHHFVGGSDAVFQAQRFDLSLRHSGQTADHAVRELQTLRLPQKLRGQRPLLQRRFHFHQNIQLVDKPLVHHGDLVDRLIIQPFPQGFRNHPDPLVVHLFQALLQILRGQGGKIIASQAVHMLLQRADGLHQRPFKAGADAHHLAGGLHLGGEGSLGGDEFIKGQTGHFYHAVVKRRLEAGVGLSCNRVFDFIQGVAQGDLCRHLGDGVAGRLARQSGGTAHTGIHLDDAVFKAGGMQGELHVAASCDLKLVDDVKSGASEHLIFLVAQGLGGCHHDAVPGVHAHRIDVFHIADCDAVSRTVAHHLILDLLPAGDAALHQHLSHTGKAQAVCQNLLQLHLVMGDTAAASAQRIGGTQHHRIADL